MPEGRGLGSLVGGSEWKGSANPGVHPHTPEDEKQKGMRILVGSEGWKGENYPDVLPQGKLSYFSLLCNLIMLLCFAMLCYVMLYVIHFYHTPTPLSTCYVAGNILSIYITEENSQ